MGLILTAIAVEMLLRDIETFVQRPLTTSDYVSPRGDSRH